MLVLLPAVLAIRNRKAKEVAEEVVEKVVEKLTGGLSRYLS